MKLTTYKTFISYNKYFRWEIIKERPNRDVFDKEVAVAEAEANIGSENQTEDV